MQLNFKSKLITITLLAVTYLCISNSLAASQKKAKSARPPNGVNCTNHMAFIETCSNNAGYSFTHSSNPFPRNANDLRKSCDKIQDGIKCMKTYVKCLGSFEKRAVSSFVAGRSRNMKPLCANNGNNQKSADFVKGFDCLMKTKRDKYQTSERDLISKMLVIGEAHDWPWDEKFHQACCAAFKYNNLVVKDAEPECEIAKVPIEEFYGSTIGDLLETVCPPTKKLEEVCPKLPVIKLPKEWKPTSLTIAALAVMSNLAETDPNSKHEN